MLYICIFYNFHIPHIPCSPAWCRVSYVVAYGGSLRWIYFSFLLDFSKASSWAGTFDFWSRLV